MMILPLNLMKLLNSLILLKKIKYNSLKTLYINFNDYNSVQLNSHYTFFPLINLFIINQFLLSFDKLIIKWHINIKK